jgi:serine/threonine protein kinase
VRGVGKVNNFGSISSCPDIFLSLPNKEDARRIGQSQTTQTKVGGGVASSSKKTDGLRHFSNSALDNPFIAPETLFSKFLDQNSALDVWSFGMIMYCLLLGKKPESYYASYRAWYKKCHGHDVEMASLPFIPPSQSNFLYDPFAIDFENPFEGEEELWGRDAGLQELGSFTEKKGKINFENFIKCLQGRSYSSLFTQESSKKFHFQTLEKKLDQGGQGSGPKAPQFPGQPTTNEDTRLRLMKAFARADVLARKNELGLILDLVSSCLDADPKRRPTIAGLQHSPLFQMDDYERTKAVRFSQNVILYRSPQSTVSMRLTSPLRSICCLAIKHPERLPHIESDILKMFAGTEDCVAHTSTMYQGEIDSLLPMDEKRRALPDDKSALFKGKDYTGLRVSPNSPLTAQLVEDKVVDMLIFLTFRYTKAFNTGKSAPAPEVDDFGSPTKTEGGDLGTKRTGASKSFAEGTQRTSAGMSTQATMQGGKTKKKRQNLILQRMTRLLKTLVYELHSYGTPMAPFVKEVTEYVTKLYVGEEYELGSDCVLRKTAPSEGTLKDYLRNRSFFRKEADLTETFKSDAADKAWHLEQRNLSFLDKSNHWSLELQHEANKIYRDAFTESGMGQSCYPVLNDYIQAVTNSFEPSKIFSKQMNHLSLSFLIPMNRTTAYYNELGPLTECLSRLYSPDLEKAGKRCALAMIRSVFQTGSSDKIKACLDMRVPKHVIHFLQDTDADVRKECLLTLLEISKGLRDEDFEIMGKSAANLKQEFSRQNYKKTAFDQHKAISLASQSEAVEADQDTDKPMGDPRTAQKKKHEMPQSSADAYTQYIKRTIALIEKNENERFINFALDLPNLNFLASKRFLREMAVCFESPVFVAPLTRLLKANTSGSESAQGGMSETFPNKEIILQIAENLYSGNERVLTALNSPACDTYMTLLRLLMQSTKFSRGASGLSSAQRNHLALQDRAIELFRFMFEQRRPTIIRDLNCIGAASTLLREQRLRIPELISLPDIVAFFDDFSELEELKPSMISVNAFVLAIKDLRCWVKHFYEESSIPELTRIKALQRCCSFLVKVVGMCWDDFKNVNADRKLEYLQLIKCTA